MLRTSAGKIWTVLSFFATVASLISLIENWSSIDLSGLFGLFLDYYRSLIYPFFSALFELVRDHPFIRLARISGFPDWLRDLWILSIFGSAPAIAVLVAATRKTSGDDEEYSMIRFALIAIIGLSLLGIPVLAFALLTLLWPANFIRMISFTLAGQEEKEQRAGGLAHWHAILVLYGAAVLIFFLLNDIASKY
jgi:hypothetical protein